MRINFKKPVYLTNVDGHADYYIGSKKPDLVYGFRGDDTIFGMDGNDVIKGGLGADLIYGGRGDDRILGEWGDDFLFGGEGDDVMTGGDGSDTFKFGGKAGVDRISDFQSGFDLMAFMAEAMLELADAVIDTIRLSTNQQHAVIEWSWQDQRNKIILSNVTAEFAAEDFEGFSFSEAALGWFA